MAATQSAHTTIACRGYCTHSDPPMALFFQNDRKRAVCYMGSKCPLYRRRETLPLDAQPSYNISRRVGLFTVLHAHFTMHTSGENRFFVRFMSLLAIVSVALAIRLYPVLSSPEKDRFGLGPFGDSYGYHIAAYNLFLGKGFSVTEEGRAAPTYCPVFTRGPGYPFFISLIYKLFSDDKVLASLPRWHMALDRVRVAQCVMDSLCCVLIFFIVRIICPGSLWVPLISSALYAVAPYNIYYTRALLSETLAAFLITLFVLLATTGMQAMKPLSLFRAGLVFGLVLLTRSEYLLFPPFFALFLFRICRGRAASAMRISSAYLLGVAIILAPWSIRNFIVLKKPLILTAGRIGEVLYGGTYHNKENWKGWDVIPENIVIDDRERQTAAALQQNRLRILYSGNIDEVKTMDRQYLKLALRRIRERPFQTAKNWFFKTPLLWYQGAFPIFRDPEPGGGWFVLYFVFALYAFFTGRAGGRRLMSPIVLLFAYLTILFIPLYVEPRYSVPVMPGIICLAGIGVGNAIALVRKQVVALQGALSRR
jgi:hypothetical protein